MWENYEYVPIAKKKKNAEKMIAKLKQKNPDLKPVIIQGNKIAKTWWGIAWNQNLESYADYANRLGRGRSYVKNGFVLDLQIKKGNITALVHGTSGSPYAVEITIQPLSEQKWNVILAQSSHKIASMEELLDGKFPDAMANLFRQKGEGLFPTPKEIQLRCSCLDWAEMCKHVAATLYGVGTRLDEDPTLFFKLRNIDFETLLKKSMDEKMKSLLQNSNQKTQRVIDDQDVFKIFGV